MSHKLQQLAFYGLLFFITAIALGAGLVSAGAEGLAFGLFASLILGGAAVCIWERYIVRSAFALMATFTGVSGFFLLLGADFLAMAQILIYVGGILALILFGVMLSPPDLKERHLGRIGLSTLLVGAGTTFIAMRVAGTLGAWAILSEGELEEPVTMAREIGLAFLHPEQYVVAFELAAFLLTVALVAAVYIARRRREDFIQPEDQA